MERELRRLSGVTVVVQRGLPEAAGFSMECDLCAVDLSCGADAGAAVAWAAQTLGDDPVAEIVFFSEDASAPEVAAVRALGISPIAAGRGARAWLLSVAPALVRVARARRELRQAESEVPRFLDSRSALGAPLPLPIAEGRFREGYIRAILARSGNRARAARQAGIPYRTMCKILQTMDINLPESTG